MADILGVAARVVETHHVGHILSGVDDKGPGTRWGIIDGITSMTRVLPVRARTPACSTRKDIWAAKTRSLFVFLVIGVAKDSLVEECPADVTCY
jgi:hypothetical protein